MNGPRHPTHWVRRHRLSVLAAAGLLVAAGLAVYFLWPSSAPPIAATATRAPKRIQTADLNDPALKFSGVYTDGWLQKSSQLVLAGGAAGSLTLRAEVPQANHLTVVVNGKTVASQSVTAGVVDLRAPIPASAGARSIELRWERNSRIGPKDARQAAALLQQIAVGSPRPPKALTHLPADLAKPNVSSSGIYKDGWLQKDASVLLAGGSSGELAIRAEVIAGQQRQQLDVVVNGRTVTDLDAAPGLLALHIPIGPSRTVRRVELHWATASRISGKDPRKAAALLKSIAIEGVRAPTSLRIANLADPNVAYSGIFKDGWLQQDARVLLAGGPAGELAVRAEVTAASGRRLNIVVNGRTVTDLDAAPGLLALNIPVRPSPSARMVELRWSATSRISADDPRQAAALLTTIAIRSVHAPTAVRRENLANPSLAYAGIYKDGWLQRNARVLLSGGGASSLTVRAEVATKSGQHLDVFVNGRHLVGRDTAAGPLDVTVPLPASKGPRVVELRWSASTRIGRNDPRQASALLRLVSVGRVEPASTTSTTAPRHSQVTRLRASLSVAQEVPPPSGRSAGEKGAFSGEVTGHALRWRLTVSGLSGPVVAAVIRAGAPGSIGVRLVPLCEPCSSPANGSVALTEAQAQQLRIAPVYVNVGTPANPGGEVRGAIRRS